MGRAKAKRFLQGLIVVTRLVSDLPAYEHSCHVQHVDKGLARDQRVEGPGRVVAAVDEVELHGE